MLVFLAIDEENAAIVWWDALRASDPGDPALREVKAQLLSGAGGADVPADVADAFFRWSETLPGWDDGPEYARAPFFLSEPIDPEDGELHAEYLAACARDSEIESLRAQVNALRAERDMARAHVCELLPLVLPSSSAERARVDAAREYLEACDREWVAASEESSF